MNPTGLPPETKPSIKKSGKLNLIIKFFSIAFITLFFSCLITLGLLFAIDHAAYNNFAMFSRLHLPALCLNIGIVLIALNFLYCLSNRWIFSAILVSYGSVFLSIFHVYKLKMMNAPLIPGDLFRVMEFVRILPALWSSRRGSLLALALMLVLAGFVFYWVFRYRWLAASRRFRLATGGYNTLLALGVLACEINLLNPNTENVLVSWINWNQRENYEANGFFLAYSTNALSLFNPVEKPKDYSLENLSGIYRQYLAALPEDVGRPATPPQEPVNVIVYLAESFWDVGRLGAQMTADPIPYYHSLLKNSAQSTSCLTRDYISPTFAGYTAKTEFEILTGCALKYLPDMSNPYASVIDMSRPIPTLPKIFKENHYQTVAIHPFDKTMWDRASVYPQMGFDEFLGIKSFKGARMDGPFISDEELVKKIIEVSQRKNPTFIFGISISTHGPYTYDDFLAEQLDVQTPMSPDSHKLLKTYINTISRADTALKHMIEHFSHEKKKTVILIFGDHLPMLGDDMRVYRELHYYNGPEDYAGKMHNATMILWANFPLPKVTFPRAAFGLKPVILQAASLRMGNFDKFVESYERSSLIQTEKSMALLDDDFKMVQYDLLFGKAYAFKGSSLVTSAPLGKAPSQRKPARPTIRIFDYGPTTVTLGQAFNRQSNGDSAIWFKTDPLPSSVTVTLNGKALSTAVGQDRMLVSASVTTAALPRAGTYSLKLIDRATTSSSHEVPLVVEGPAPSFVPPPVQ